jgi:hydrogenase expression/formation protein HypE
VGPHRAQAGDAILVSGTIGDHGMAIMSVREGLEFESQIRSDCAALNGLIADVLQAVGPAVHAMRDPTRGGLASTLNEIAQSSGVGAEIDEPSLPRAKWFSLSPRKQRTGFWKFSTLTRLAAKPRALAV